MRIFSNHVIKLEALVFEIILEATNFAGILYNVLLSLIGRNLPED
jgi:hypothetical protein